MKAKIYTKTGDKGQTSLVGGARVAKSDPRLEAYGTVDELNSVLGLLRASLPAAGLAKWGTRIDASLQAVQNNLFNIGSHLACADENLRPALPQLTSAHVQALENDMDSWEKELPQLTNFILPGGGTPAAYAHLARTVCRRAERACVRLQENAAISELHLIFLNRLSDWLFLLARRCNHELKISDKNWTK